MRKTKKLLTVALAIALLPNLAIAATWQYTALGDSLSYGTGATNNQGYANLYKSHVEADNQISVNLTNLGVPGWTSADLLAYLKSNGTFRNSVVASDVITINIGGNDLLRAVYLYKSGTCSGKKNNKCLKTATAKLKTNWKKIFSLVKKLRRKKSTIIRTMNLYYAAVTMDQNNDSFAGDAYSSDFAFFNPYLAKTNASLSKIARQKKILVANVHALYNGSSGTEDPQTKGYICADGLHPNDTGYQVMADELENLGYSSSK